LKRQSTRFLITSLIKNGGTLPQDSPFVYFVTGNETKPIQGLSDLRKKLTTTAMHIHEIDGLRRIFLAQEVYFLDS
jgi:hypothetical protein